MTEFGTRVTPCREKERGGGGRGLHDVRRPLRMGGGHKSPKIDDKQHVYFAMDVIYRAHNNEVNETRKTIAEDNISVRRPRKSKPTNQPRSQSTAAATETAATDSVTKPTSKVTETVKNGAPNRSVTLR